MIVPKTHESTWLEALNDLPAFVPGYHQLVIVSPHPDDETLGAGALIAAHCNRGGKATIVAVTDGENAYENFPGLASIRTREQQQAVQQLGGENAKIVRLGLTDSAVSMQEEALAEALSSVITPDTHVLAPWIGDFHPDHEACGRAASAAARKAGARLTWYFFWTWHRGMPDQLDKLSLQKFPFDETIRRTKMDCSPESSIAIGISIGRTDLAGISAGPSPKKFRGLCRGMTTTTSEAFFEAKYRAAADPWDFARNDYELNRYQRILSALGGRRFALAYEPGCSVGVLTAGLGTICERVEACDISITAVEKAKERCRNLSNIHIRHASLTDLEPVGADLYVFSEVGYYMPRAELFKLLARYTCALRAGATFIACHWRGASTDHLLSGDEVHEVIDSLPALMHEYGECHAEYRLDRWVIRKADL